VLQGKAKRAMRSTTRFVVNSTVGVLGLFDVAAKMGLPRRDADFGQTFGRWGVGPGAYVYVPVMGPLNVRDGVGRVLDIVTDPVSIFAAAWRPTSARPARRDRSSTCAPRPIRPSRR
jgi:phospholipid-binding lipoprotein MlaA